MIHANDNHTGLRYLSVCSGIEAATVAWSPLNWKAVAFSEIEKFPSAVLKHHYPDVPNLGDFTKINTKTLGRVDILAGGTPCQAFSVAGLRQGLGDARGNLTLKFVELAHELANGNGLRNVVWENVVGVLSDKGNAFGCFLAGLVGADTAIEPPRRGKWARHGMVSGPKGRAAWSVKDGQFFGVAQRRRRVLVVADFGNGADPAAVLFEPESMFRDTPPSREAGKSITHPVAPSLVSSGRGIERTGDTRGQDPVVAVEWPAEVASTLNAAFGEKLGLENQHINSGAPLFVPSVHAIQAGALRTNPNSGPDGVGVQEGVAYTIEARAEVQAVCVTGDIAHTLKAEGADASEDGTGRGTQIVAQSVAIRGRDGGATAELGGDIANALRASQGGGDKPHVLATRDVAGAITSNYGKQLDNSDTALGPNVAIHHSAVRRLTPRECERLQGFEDNYTRIPIKHYATQKITKNRPADMWEKDPNGGWWLMAADGPRYKSLGNSWAVPKFQWLGMRLDAAYKSLRLGQTPQGQPQEASKRFSPANDVHDHEPQRSQKHAG